jgi:hypothetical protein
MLSFDVRSLANPCYDFIHGVVNELLPKLSQDVRLESSKADSIVVGAVQRRLR